MSSGELTSDAEERATREGFTGLVDRRQRMVGRILRAVRDRAGKDRRLELLCAPLVWNDLRSFGTRHFGLNLFLFFYFHWNATFK